MCDKCKAARLGSPEVQRVVEQVFPELDWYEKQAMERVLWSLLETKDIGRFTGAIHPHKQQAISDISLSDNRAAEKDTRKRLDQLVSKLEREMLHWHGRLKTDDASVKIDATKFKKEMKRALFLAYHEAYKLGTRAAGLPRSAAIPARTSEDEQKWLQSIIKKEQEYFDSMLNDAVRNDSITQSRARIRNYANAVRSVFDSSRVLQLPEGVLIYWVVESHNPCPECQLLHRLSPFTRGTMPTTPKAGSTRCLSYCYCKLRIVKASPAEVNSVARRNRSAQFILSQLEMSRKRKP